MTRLVPALLLALAGTANAEIVKCDPAPPDRRALISRDLQYYEQECARGKREFCVSAACTRVLLDDSDSNLVACARAHGFRVGDGWVALEEGRQIPGGLRPDWSINITCLRKVDGNRPHATVWRKFSVPADSFDLDAEARKECQAKYLEAGRKGKIR